MPHSFALHTTTCAGTAEAGSQENLLQYGRKLEMAHSSLQKGNGPWATHEPAEGIGPVVCCLHLNAEQTCVLGEAGQVGQLACAQHVLSTTTPLTSYLWGLGHVLRGTALGHEEDSASQLTLQFRKRSDDLLAGAFAASDRSWCLALVCRSSC